MYKAYLFDMDGTLVDTFDLIYESFNLALAENGKNQLTKKDFDKKLFGKPVGPTLPRLIRAVDQEEMKCIMERFQVHWLQDLDKVKVFKNVPLTLERLKANGYKLGVVSTSPRDVIIKTLMRTDILKFFDIIIGDEDTKRKKPDPEPVSKAVKVLGLKPNETVFVGDTVYDIIAGKTAGCRTIFMLNKYNGDVLDKETPDCVVRDISELAENGCI